MLNYRGVVIENLIRVGLRSPGCRDSLDGEKVFRGVRDAMQWAAVMAAVNFLFRGTCLGKCDFRSQARIGIQLRTELFAAMPDSFASARPEIVAWIR